MEAGNRNDIPMRDGSPPAVLASASEGPDLTSRRLMQLSSRLVQLDKRNPTIRLFTLARERAFDVTVCERFNAGSAARTLENILYDKSSIVLNYKDRPHGVDDPETAPAGAEPSKRSREEFRIAQAWQKTVSHLTMLRRRKNANYEESGSQDFYLGFPWISGCCADGDRTFLQAPLLLLPVDLDLDRSKGVKWKLTPAQNQYPIFNSTLVQALERFHESKLPAEFIEEAEAYCDDNSHSPEEMMEWFGKQLPNFGVNVCEISYPLRPLPLYKSSEAPTSTRGFSLSSHAVFGVFPLSNSALKQDYEAMQAMEAKNPGTLPSLLSELLSAEINEDYTELAAEGSLTMDNVPEAETCFVIQSDSSQEEVLLQARREPRLVVHGPPGTGKSQVIVNLVADALSRGERVVVCCQKRAALDVVYQRLDKNGLSRHCALVHDASADRKELYAAIARAMDSEAIPQGIGPDLDFKIAQLAKQIDVKTATLKNMAHELHRPQRFGMRARDLYALTAEKAPPAISCAKLAATMTRTGLEAFQTRISNIAQAQAAIPAGHPWEGRASFAQRTRFDAPKAEATLQAPPEAAAKLKVAVVAVGIADLSGDLIVNHAAALELLEQRAQALQVDGAAAILEVLASGGASPAAIGQSLALLRQHIPKLAALPPKPRETLCENAATMAFHLENYLANYGSFFKFLKGAFRDAKKVVEPYLGIHGIAKNDQALREAITELRSQQRWRSFELESKELAYHEGLAGLRTADQVAALIQAYQAGLEAFAAQSKLSEQHQDLVAAFGADGLSQATQAIAAMREVLTAAEGWAAALASMDAWLTPNARDRLHQLGLSSADDALEKLAAMREALADFDDLVTLDSELAKCSEGELAVYQALRDSEIASGAWAESVRLSVLFAWVEEAERTSPMLRDVSGPSFAHTQHTFSHDIAARRKLNRLRLQRQGFAAATEIRFEPGRVIDKRHSAEKPFNDLRHQVTKKSRLWSLRRLVSTLWWPLREVMPVWLVSPETLSAAFPLEAGLFDMVIFDEASQCAVEHGIPAAFRAKHLVVAGDDQQLQPNKAFQAASEFNEDDEPRNEDGEAEDVEAVETKSFLRLARARFPQRMLTWHYRSKFEELIDFSNHGFYDGRLKTAPDTLASMVLPPIQYFKVEDGRWLERANRVEGERVVETIYELLLKHGARKSIGVITFNVTQREMILNIIDERSNKDAEFAEAFTQARGRENLDDALFVKNIENVQGDERDIIIFSIGYGPGADGRVRANFGSLSQEGGENRLNVAVSRAREAIIVVASIEPEELNVANSKNRGPRLVRQYLEYARAVSRSSEEMRQAVLKEIDPAMDIHHAEGQTFESPFEEMVCEALEKHGLKVHTQVGVSGYRLDLAIVDPNLASRFVLGIECDGATYHSAPSVRERDAYRQGVLEARGWKIYRIWSRNWWNNPEREVRKILELVKKNQSPAPPAEPEDPVLAAPASNRPGPYQGEFPPEGEIRAWIEARRDGFVWFAIGDFGAKGRMDEYGWHSDQDCAGMDCVKAQSLWLGEHQLAPNRYIKPELADTDGE